MSGSRYTRNRNEWRKGYGFSRRKPVIAILEDPVTNKQYSLNLQETYRDRDFYIREPYSSGHHATPFPLGEYDEGIIVFGGSNNEETIFFNITFSGPPIVTFELQPGSDYNVNLYGKNISDNSVTVCSSAPFTGEVKYRAVYSPTYPATFSSPDVSQFVASANYVDLSNQASYTGIYDYDDDAGNILYLYSSMIETGTGESNVHNQIINHTTVPPEINGNISSASTARVNYIIVFENYYEL